MVGPGALPGFVSEITIAGHDTNRPALAQNRLPVFDMGLNTAAGVRFRASHLALMKTCLGEPLASGGCQVPDETKHQGLDSPRSRGRCQATGS